MFTIRNVNANIHCDKLKDLIRRQLSDDITTDDFDVGFFDGSNTIRIRTKEDLAEVWGEMQKKSKITLWCDGLIIQGKNTDTQKRTKDVDTDEGTSCKKKPDREGKVQEIVENLKAKHASLYTAMQMRIWAEMITSGMYSRMDEPPNTSMFIRAGGKSVSHSKQTPVMQAITDAATALTSALSPKQIPASDSNKVSTQQSPAKVIENRSRLYKQLSELCQLHKEGVLTEDEYKIEKDSIMQLLQQLKNQ